MEWLFGRRKTPEEMLKEHQRALKKAMRGIDREKSALQKQETKLIADIKKSAKAQQMEATRIMAKDLVRTRKQVNKMMMMHTQIQAVSLKIQTMKSISTMANAMKGVAKAMGKMNKSMNLPQLTAIMKQFEKEAMTMDAKQEMMDDMIDDAMGDADDEDEENAIVDQVLDELGLAQVGDIQAAPEAAPKGESVAEDDDLMQRLKNLRP